jgi:hypothetical protein
MLGALKVDSWQHRGAGKSASLAMVMPVRWRHPGSRRRRDHIECSGRAEVDHMSGLP